MLADLGLPILLLMLGLLALNLLFGLVAMLLYLSRRHPADAARTFLYLLIITASSAASTYPTLRMHGSFSDMDRLLLLGWHLGNVLAMLLFLASRLRLILRSRRKNTQQQGDD